MIIQNKKSTALILLLIVLFTSCKKLIEVDAPVTSTNSEIVYNSDATAAAVLNGIYINMSKSNFTSGGLISMSLFPSLSGDELTLYNFSNQNALFKAYYTNTLTNLNTGILDFWNTIYSVIYVTNDAIEGLSKSTELTPKVKQQLMGEAKFIRAYCYFYLVNLYGDVPLTLKTNYEENRLLSRNSKDKVYQQIITDLLEAEQLLSDGFIKSDRINLYPSGSAERIFPNKWAAKALLARVYLYSYDYANAGVKSTEVLNNNATFDTVTVANVFLKNSKEAVWQLQPVRTDITNTQDARLFVLPSTGPTTTGIYPVYLSNSLVNSFETNDKRKINWTGNVTIPGSPSITYYYAYKYKVASLAAPVSEYLMVLRLGEQYLIRAEARAQQNNVSGAQSDLNIIRNRAGLANTTANDKNSLLTVILHERQVELFTEWGHRWLDMKRTNTLDAVMNVVSPQKGGNSWSPNWGWYPVSQYELDKNPSMVQNSGY